MIQDRADVSYDLTRLVVEKVASINTTAAGGNASLMSLAGGEEPDRRLAKGTIYLSDPSKAGRQLLCPAPSAS